MHARLGLDSQKLHGHYSWKDFGVSAVELLSFGQTCLLLPLANSCGANAALSQPHHRKNREAKNEQKLIEKLTGAVLPKKVDLFKDVFHSDPSVLS